MSKGFFSQAEVASRSPAELRAPKCGLCGLHKTCHSPKMEVTGKGRKGILVVAEAPGEQEDRHGIQLIGDAGKRLRRSLHNIGINLDIDCWKTNAIICRPPRNVTPDSDKILACRPNLFGAIDSLKPKIVIVLGAVALRSLIGRLWKEDIGKFTRWTGWEIPAGEIGAWVVPTWHPSYLLRKEKDKALGVLFERHLFNAVALIELERPSTPDYEMHVGVEVSPRKASKAIKDIRRRGKLFVFDYETNCLKPETHNARILTCSITNDVQTISFPWHGEAIDAMCRLLQSEVPCAAHNAKFEHRWSNLHAAPVRNLVWCSMLAAHVLDNRQEVTGLKFQSFVRLGVPVYDSHIEPYRRNRKGQPLNRLHQVDIHDLLLYGGLDSAISYDLTQLQMEEINGSKSNDN